MPKLEQGIFKVLIIRMDTYLGMPLAVSLIRSLQSGFGKMGLLKDRLYLDKFAAECIMVKLRTTI